MKKLFLFFCILNCLFIFDVKAETCDRDEFNRLKELAEKVEFSYDSEIVDAEKPLCGDCKGAVHSITAYNLNEEITVRIIYDYYTSAYDEFEYNKEKVATLEGYASGNVKITFKGLVKNACSGETVLTKTIKLPYYNPFYGTEVCQEYSEFKYCKDQFVDQELEYYQFQKLLENYKKELEDSKQGSLGIAKIHDYKNILVVSGIFFSILLVVIVIVIIMKKKKDAMDI